MFEHLNPYLGIADRVGCCGADDQGLHRASHSEGGGLFSAELPQHLKSISPATSPSTIPSSTILRSSKLPQPKSHTSLPSSPHTHTQLTTIQHVRLG